VSEPKTVLLGLIAGGTIVLGMPLGRLRAPRPVLRQMLNAVAIGILVFLLWDVLSGAWEPIDAALSDVHDHSGGLAPVFGYGALFFGGLVVGLMSLVYYEGWIDQRRARTRSVGAMAIADAAAGTRGLAGWSEPRRLALMIAVGIGVHNFGEGLAIGTSAATGEIALATVLVIGFALHNATEGFGIVAPLAAESEMPSWRTLFGLAAIGGGPTILGTLVGYHVTSDAMSVLFLTLAAGSILYVVVQLLGMAQRAVVRRDLLFWGVILGLAAGFITDMVVTAGGV
jgi:zinc transporter, ZIP family